MSKSQFWILSKSQLCWILSESNYVELLYDLYQDSSFGMAKL